jgi:flavin-dependent dehydrogenase
VKATTGGGVYYGLVSAALAADVLSRSLASDELGERSLARYEGAWRKQLGAELRAQLSLRSIAQRLKDDEIEGLFDLARHDGVMPIVRRTARFNHHRDLIVSLLRHPPVRQLLLRRLAGRGLRAATEGLVARVFRPGNPPGLETRPACYTGAAAPLGEQP